MNQKKSGTPTYLEMTESQQLAVRERILSRTIPEHRGRTDTPCWAWQGAKDYKGYGQIFLREADGFVPSILRRAHRAAYAAFIGPVEDGLQVEHLCHFSSCCNPTHLALATSKVNNRRKGNVLSNRTHCNSGRHLLSDLGTIKVSNGGETCKACHEERGRANYLKRKADGYYLKGSSRSEDVAS